MEVGLGVGGGLGGWVGGWGKGAVGGVQGVGADQDHMQPPTCCTPQRLVMLPLNPTPCISSSTCVIALPLCILTLCFCAPCVCAPLLQPGKQPVMNGRPQLEGPSSSKPGTEQA